MYERVRMWGKEFRVAEANVAKLSADQISALGGEVEIIVDVDRTKPGFPQYWVIDEKGGLARASSIQHAAYLAGEPDHGVEWHEVDVNEDGSI